MAVESIVVETAPEVAKAVIPQIVKVYNIALPKFRYKDVMLLALAIHYIRPLFQQKKCCCPYAPPNAKQ